MENHFTKYSLSEKETMPPALALSSYEKVFKSIMGNITFLRGKATERLGEK